MRGVGLNSKIVGLQAGVSSKISIPGGQGKQITVTFPRSYDKIPTVVCVPRSNSPVTFECTVYDYNTGGFTATLTNRGSGQYEVQVLWMTFPMSSS